MARILIIDDQSAVRGLLAGVLSEAGHEIYQAGDGEAGLDVIRKNPVDLVVTDILMPGRDGLETIVELRRSHCHVPILAMSGGGRLSAGGYLDLAVQLGANRALPKSASSEEFLEAVRELLGNA